MTTPLQQTLATQPLPPIDTAAQPAWFAERRQQALFALAAASWPQRKDEAWRYTSLHELAQLAPQPASASVQLPATVDDAALAFVAGHGVDGNAPPFIRRLADVLATGGEAQDALRFHVAAQPAAGDVFDLANTAFASDGVLVDVPAGYIDEVWYRIHISGADAGDARHWHLANRIDLGEGANLRLHLDQDAQDAPGLATIASHIRIRKGAHLELASTRTAGVLASVVRNRIELDAGARLTLHVLDAGSAPSRHDLTITLRGERAQADVGGVFLLDARRHADVQLELRHESPDTFSNTTWRAIANERARAVFNGHITVAKGADGTDAQLGCKSLLGSLQAEIDAKPVLEIYADDVKCSHGATVGQLDAQALFYLRSRGIGEEQARSMLTRAFAAEAFGERQDSPAAVCLGQWLEAGA